MPQAKKTKRDGQTKGNGRARAGKLVDLVQRQVEDGATSVEEVHKSIANLPLDVLERLDLFDDAVKGARKVQQARIGAIYDLIRKVNEEVSRLAKEILTGSAERKPARARTARATARRRAS